MAGRAYNLGQDSANLSKEEVALKIQAFVPNFYAHLAEIGTDPDKRNYVVSSERLRQAGFEARRSLENGIRELLNGVLRSTRLWCSSACSETLLVRERWTTELFGNYTPEIMLIRVWMRTAVRKEISN